MATAEDAAAGGSRRPYLVIEGLNKFFGDFQALKDVSLEVCDGEFICFLGPSGCGKTTLLRAIAGLDIQTSGRIRQADRDISRTSGTSASFSSPTRCSPTLPSRRTSPMGWRTAA
jgi:iron(III) transport system ATP-binding protein